ncbi:class I SAM-dependent methyltransferase [bacterium]|nr:class I SAM-dependent methyltransferase [Candidatus Elulimicrobium humile]
MKDKKLADIIPELTVFTDKYDLGYIDEFYEDLFSPIRYSTTSILEIGIKNGGSILLWKEYFPNATVIGIDIHSTNNLKNKDKIIQIIDDAYSKSTISKFEENSFDIIIDDGPHTTESQIFFLKEYFKLLKPGGVMILEDIIDTSQTKNFINLIDSTKASVQVYNMIGKQKRPDWLSNWSKGLDVIIIRKFKND